MKFKRISALLLATFVFCGSLPVEALASIIPKDPPDKGRITTEDVGVTDDYDPRLDLQVVKENQAIEVAKIVNTASIKNLDYIPTIDRENIRNLLPELNYADIIEYEQRTNNDFKLVQTDSKIDTYNSRLDYLLRKSILVRECNYIYNNTNIIINNERLLANGTDAVSDQALLTNRYYSSNIPVSKTDLIVGLMKTDGIIPSKPIIIMHPYRRMFLDFTTGAIKSEYLSVSPYTSLVGDMGIDTYLKDVKVYHDVYNQLEYIQSSDVVELYLQKALSKGIINEDDFDLVTSSDASGVASAVEVFNDAFSNTDIAARQFYGELNANKNKKANNEIEQDALPKIETVMNGGALYPWGNSFSYSCNSCVFSDPHSQTPVQITKRLSRVEVQNGIKDPTRPDDEGYCYFKDEEMTVLQAYKVIADFLRKSGNEHQISQEELNIFSSRYAAKIEGATDEEIEAVKLLIVLGIIDGSDPSLPYAYNRSFTTNDFVNILYTVDNLDARYQNMAPVSEMDIEMANKGYSKAQVTVNDTEPVKELETMAVPATKEGSSVSYTDRMIDDRVKDPSEYDYLYIRYPKDLDTQADSNKQSFSLVGLFSYGHNRVKVEPLDRELNGGMESFTDGSAYPAISEEDAARNINRFTGTSVFIDEDGYYWHRFIIHKDLTTNMYLQCYQKTNLVNIKGITGPGVYILKSDDAKTFSKISFDEAESYFKTRDIYKYVIKPDIDMTNTLKKQIISDNTDIINKANKALGYDETLIWSQFALADPTDNVAQNQLITVDIENAEDIYYQGKNLFTVQNGELALNEDAIPAGKRHRFSVSKQSDGKYQCIYESPYKNADFFTLTEYSNLTSRPGADPIDVLNGYVKIQKDGEDIILVTQGELKQLGIEVIGEDKGGTGRTLRNPKTGQYAFFNSDDDIVMIGNNVTQYNKGTLLCIASDGTIFYNLKSALELIDDTNTVIDRAGTDILVSLLNTNTENEEYKLVNIINKTDSLDPNEQVEIIDRTYLLLNKNSTDTIYMSLSALTGYCSNFIYYKNRSEGRQTNALLVYQPKASLTETIEYDKQGNIVNYTGVNQSVNNSLLANTQDQMYPDKEVKGVRQNAVLEKARDLYVSGMMGVPGNKIDSGLISGNYDLKLVLFGDNGPSSQEAANDIKDFLFTIADEDATDFRLLLQQTFIDLGNNDATSLSNGGTEVRTEMDKVYQAAGTKLIENPSIKLEYIKADSELTTSKTGFVLHKATGNLYVKLKPDGGMRDRLQGLLGQRFFLNLNLSKINDNDYYKYNYITFRGYKSYENTPKGMIPLEIIGTQDGGIFNTLDNPNNKEGKVIMDKFFEGKDYQLYKPTYNYTDKNGNTSTNTEQATNFIYKFTYNERQQTLQDVGYGTIITLKPQELTNEEAIKILYGDPTSTERKIQDYEKFTDEYFTRNLELIEKSNVLGDYTPYLREALGLGSTKIKVGVDMDVLPATKAEFLKGCAIPSFNEDKQVKAFAENATNTEKNYMIFMDISSNFLTKEGNIETQLNLNGLGITGTGANGKSSIAYITNKGTYKPYTVSKDNGTESNTLEEYYKKLKDVMAISYPNVTVDPCDICEDSNWEKIGNTTSYKFTGDLHAKSGIYIRPSITIPAGTTLVDRNYNLIFAPNDKIRSEIPVQNNILNALIMRAAINSGELDVTYLCEVEQGSVIKFADGTYMAKVSEAQEYPHKQGKTGDTKKLKYVRLLSDLLDDSQSAPQDGSRLKFFEINLLEHYLRSFYNLRVPYNFGEDTTFSESYAPKIRFNKILSSAKYRLPTIDEARFAINTESNFLKWHTKKDNTSVYVMNTSTVNSLPEDYRDPSKKDKMDVLSYTTVTLPISAIKNNPDCHQPGQLQSSAQDNMVDSALGATSLLFNVAPTVVVKDITPAGNQTSTKVYEVINYHDFGSMIFDSEGQFVSYLTSKNKDIPDVQGIMDAVKSDKYNADEYKVLTFAQRFERLVKKVFIFTITYLPLIILALFLWTLIWDIIYYFPLMNYAMELFIQWFHFDIGALLTFNIVSINKGFSKSRILRRFIGFALISGILWTGIIQNILFILLYHKSLL